MLFLFKKIKEFFVYIIKKKKIRIQINIKQKFLCIYIDLFL